MNAVVSTTKFFTLIIAFCSICSRSSIQRAFVLVWNIFYENLAMKSNSVENIAKHRKTSQNIEKILARKNNIEKSGKLSENLYACIPSFYLYFIKLTLKKINYIVSIGSYEHAFAQVHFVLFYCLLCVRSCLSPPSQRLQTTCTASSHLLRHWLKILLTLTFCFSHFASTIDFVFNIHDVKSFSLLGKSQNVFHHFKQLEKITLRFHQIVFWDLSPLLFFF